jgi:hypothetical protein
VDPLGCEHVRPDCPDQRHQARGRGADPIGQRADVDPDRFAGVDRALAGQRQVLAVLGGQNQGKQVRSGAATGDRVRGRRGLADRLVAAAGNLLAHMLDDFPAPRHAFQGLGDVLAELAHRAAAFGAGAGHGVEDPLARQVLGQVPAGRFAGAIPVRGERSTTAAAISAATSASDAVSSSSLSCSSSWSISRLSRSLAWPNCSRRALASSSFRRMFASQQRMLSLRPIGTRVGLILRLRAAVPSNCCWRDQDFTADKPSGKPSSVTARLACMRRPQTVCILNRPALSLPLFTR